MAQKYGVQSYPTIKVFRKDKKTPDDFQGGRDLASLQEAAEQLYLASRPPPEVPSLTSKHVCICLQAIEGSHQPVSVSKELHMGSIGLSAWAHGLSWATAVDQSAR